MLYTLVAQKLDFRSAAQEQGLSNVGETPSSTISRILSVVMVIAVLLVLLYLITGAFEWITAGGEKGKIESARGKITGAVVGLIVLASTLAILVLVQRFIGVQVFAI